MLLSLMARPSDASRRAPNGLSERERDVLRRIVHHFIQTASPVASRVIAEDVDLSSASIRTTMQALEQAGYLGHPHTSAGRVPTDLGYRLYVDELMDLRGLSPREANVLREAVRRRLGDLDGVAREASRLLGRLARQLGVVLTPRLSTGVLERLEAVQLAPSRVLFVLALRGGVARTVTIELDDDVSQADLDAVVQRLNERLAGLSLQEIRRTGAERVQDLEPDDGTGVVRVVLRETPTLFRGLSPERRASIGGARHLVGQPEFSEPESVRDVVELAESEDIVVHLLERPEVVQPDEADRSVVLIGREVDRGGDGAASYSMVTAPYRVGDATGAVAVIGPTRMDYAHAVALVEYVSTLLSEVTAS